MSWTPRPWQARFLRAVIADKATLLGIRGGWGSGKSAALVVCARVLAETRPGAVVVIVMDSYTRLRDVHLPLCMEHLAGAGAEYHASSKEFAFRNGSKVVLRYFAERGGIGRNPLEGLNAHACLIDECQTLPPTTLRTVGGRVRIEADDLNGVACPPVVVLCGIPVEPAWWIDATRNAGGVVFLPTSAENREALSDQWFEDQRRRLTPEEYDALINNRPTATVGQVLSNWSVASYPDGNIIEDFTHDPALDTWLTIDLGRRSPAALVIQRDEDRDLWVVTHDWQPNNLTTEELCRYITDRAWPTSSEAPSPRGVRYSRLVCDPAGQARNAQTGLSDVELLRRPPPAGLGLAPRYELAAHKRQIPAGIARLRRLICDGEGRRRLVCTREVWEQGLRAPTEQRTFARAVGGYRYPETGGDTPVKDGFNDHVCFVAGTMIETEDGPKPIESIQVGERVWTRKGLRRVLAAGCTAVDVPVMELETTAGHRLIGTPDHPIWTEESGFVPLGGLMPTGTVLTWQAQSMKPSSGAPSTGGIPSPPTAPTGSTTSRRAGTEAPATCTWTSGETATPERRFRPDTSSTTRTTTRSTTTRETSSASRSPSTSGTTSGNTGTTRRSVPDTFSTSNECARSPLSGTEATRAESGTGSTGKPCGLKSNPEPSPASSAARITSPRSEGGPASARTPARRRLDSTAGSMTRIGSAPSAGAPSGRTSTSRPEPAPVRVLDVRAVGSADVFNLTVDDAHEYFANGVLVSNCDALRYFAILPDVGWFDSPLDGRRARSIVQSGRKRSFTGWGKRASFASVARP